MDEYFFVDERFYTDVFDLVEDIKYWEDIDDISELPDEYKIEVTGSKLEPMFVFDLQHVLDTLSEDRMPFESERTENELIKVLKDNINFDAINENMPKLYYEDRSNRCYITKQDIINYIS